MEVRTALYMTDHLRWQFNVIIYDGPLKVELHSRYMIDNLMWKFMYRWFNYKSRRIGGLDRRSLRRPVTGGLSTSTHGASRGVGRTRPGVSHKSDIGGDDGSSRFSSTKEARLRRMIVLPSVRTW